MQRQPVKRDSRTAVAAQSRRHQCGPGSTMLPTATTAVDMESGSAWVKHHRLELLDLRWVSIPPGGISALSG